MKAYDIPSYYHQYPEALSDQNKEGLLTYEQELMELFGEDYGYVIDLFEGGLIFNVLTYDQGRSPFYRFEVSYAYDFAGRVKLPDPAFNIIETEWDSQVMVVNVEKESLYQWIARVKKKPQKRLSVHETAPLTFDVDTAFQKEFTLFASKHEMPMAQVLHEAFELVKEKYS